MDNETKLSETPDEFLDALGKKLIAMEGVDKDLAGVLTAHILRATPTQNAVVQAKDAIMRLAGKRADPPKVAVMNG
ncbi:hypothetical protein PVW53_21220 [Seohaeicola sp. SP36]|uniref:hypothetical protein n=1 Tax=unclassified Seohaeicola TaxID=2641111 RepID=UPI00237B4D86|nr:MULTISPECIES: hypothetical protein [unclassified Seohaeicola]MDD9709802.1 hypothetical protein [Seohaeicola sp. 4SK31]MDD9738026.1 hypothetical protein [Seohaeicola sp. SP36]